MSFTGLQFTSQIYNDCEYPVLQTAVPMEQIRMLPAKKKHTLIIYSDFRLCYKQTIHHSLILRP